MARSFRSLSTLWSSTASSLDAPRVGVTTHHTLRLAKAALLTRASTLSFQRRHIYENEQARSEKTAFDLTGKSPFQDFDLTGGVYVVTGGARGLGLSLASGIAQAGGTVYCLDRLAHDHNDSSSTFSFAQSHISPSSSGSLHYSQVDVTDAEDLNGVIAGIADKHQRLDGCVAAAGIQKICPALEYPVKDAREMLDVNLLGVFNTAVAVARQVYRFAEAKEREKGEEGGAHEDGNADGVKTLQPSIVLIASMSGLVANKGLISPMYNASKAGVTQLTRNLAMEWGRPRHGISIRVNALSPGHIVTPMVEKNFEEVPELKEIWERENMLGRLSRPEEFRGAAVFLLSRASSFMTGGTLVIDGGHTAW